MDWKLIPLKKHIDIAGLYSFHYSEFNKDYYFPGERHDFWEMIYVDSGEMLATVDTQEFKAKQGDVIFYKPMAFHASKTNQKNSLSILVTSFEASGESMDFFVDKVFTLDKQQRKLLALFLSEGRKSFPNQPSSPENVGAYQLTINYLEQLLIDLIRKNNKGIQGSPADFANVSGKENLAEAIDAYLENHLYEQLQLADICRHFNKSSSGLCRLYKSVTGTSIMDHYLELKITQAKRMLLDGEWNVTQISERLGFGSIYYFTRVFKSKTGMPPSAYEKTIRDWQTSHNRTLINH